MHVKGRPWNSPGATSSLPQIAQLVAELAPQDSGGTRGGALHRHVPTSPVPSAPRARALLHATLSTWGIAQTVREEAELILTELVANALRIRVPHGRPVGVRITRSPADVVLRLEVSDAGAGRPEVKTPDTDDPHGRGLLLVEALAPPMGRPRTPRRHRQDRLGGAQGTGHRGRAGAGRGRGGDGGGGAMRTGPGRVAHRTQSAPSRTRPAGSPSSSASTTGLRFACPQQSR
ncbi:ATP-binding protein [Streptomyces sp. NPDC102384]|uniref:ATP-binding protein n=1 Tax=Streptomyces sp. NPDC102384 TaxID=3366166 RepID=UPI003809B36E